MQVLAVVVHFQRSSWVVLFGGVGSLTLTEGVFHIRTSLSNASLVVKEGKKKGLGKAWDGTLWKDVLRKL